MDDRRNDDPGRREDDKRWLKVQSELMNLVTAQRTSQQVISKVEIELGKIADHVDDVDDHLRGVSGHESMDTRMAIVEREVTSHGVILHQISKDVGQITKDLAGVTIHRAISKEFNSSRMDRFKEWLKFWGAIIVASIALIVPLAKVFFDYRAKIRDNVDYRPDEKIRKQIELDKKSQHAKDVQKKLTALEQIQAQNH